MAKGYGRTLDFLTLLVLLRNKLNDDDEQAFDIHFDKDRGFTAWFSSSGMPDSPKWYETYDSAMLSLLIGEEKVPGVEDYGGN